MSLVDGIDLDRVAAELATKRAELEAEITGLEAPAEDTGGISFGKGVSSISVAMLRKATLTAVYQGRRHKQAHGPDRPPILPQVLAEIMLIPGQARARFPRLAGLAPAAAGCRS